MVCFLGQEKSLVGRSHECDYPASVSGLPVCTEPNFDIHCGSKEIDRRVKDLLQSALSIYRVHAHRLRELKPDVILTQTQCEVCAVSLRDVEAAVCELLDFHPHIVALAPNALADVWTDLARVAQAMDVAEQGKRAIEGLKARMAAIRQRARAIPKRQRVACVEWIDPLMAAGNWMPELVEMAGGINLFGEAGKHSPWMTWEALLGADPDIVIVLPCGFDIPRSRAEMAALTERPDWKALRAARERQVFLADGNQFFNRPGPRLVESLEILAQIFYGQAYSTNMEGIGWERLVAS
jgi:iron complex transport system substrate-binding protein